MSKYSTANNETPRYTGTLFADISKSDGGLPHVVGASHYQVLRANRQHTDTSDGIGYTYNHAPDMTYWNGMFWIQYLSNRIDEHEPGGLSLITYSHDGICWSTPTVSFPKLILPSGENVCSDGTKIIIPENEYAVMHQRTAFYISPDGRLLTTGFYGYSPNHAAPWEKYGLGRVIREIYPDGSFGPIYFIYIMKSSGWNQDVLPFPHYSESSDDGFVNACNALLDDKFETQQWAEEHGNECEYVSLKTHNEVFGRNDNHPYQAFTRYHINENTVVALWKHSVVGISYDNGVNWLIKRETSFATSGAKMWGQKTSDCKYALLYINSLSSEHRYPLVCVTSDNGIDFDEIATVFGETPPRRYEGLNKDFGPQYIRGISESCDNRPNDALWITYSVNKEDIWVSRIPVPVLHDASNFFCGDFKNNLYFKPWNIYSSKWSKIENRNGIMFITDQDPVDYALAELNFPACEYNRTELVIQCSNYDQALEIELADSNGLVCLRIYIEEGKLFGRYTSVKTYISEFNDNPHRITLEQDCYTCDYKVYVDGSELATLRNIQKVNSVSRLLIRTKPLRNAPGMEKRPIDHDLPDTDSPVDLREYSILFVSTAKILRN